MDEILLDSSNQEQISSDYVKSFYKDDVFNVSVSFKSDFKNAKHLRDFIILTFETIWINPIWKSRFTLITDELNNNSIEYWSKEGENNTMRIYIKKTPENEFDINVEVEDAGNWKSPQKAKDMEKLRNNKLKEWFENHTFIRWRWLFMIITKLVDELYFKDSNKWWLIVWVNKKILI